MSEIETVKTVSELLQWLRVNKIDGSTKIRTFGEYCGAEKAEVFYTKEDNTLAIGVPE